MLRLVWARCGFGILVLWLVDSLLRRTLPLHILVIRRHPAAFLQDVPLHNPAGYEVRVATREELLRTAAADPAMMSAEFLETALRKGDQCVAVFDAGRIVSASWCARTPTRVFDNVWLKLGTGCMYGYNAATLPRYRGQGLHALSINYTGRFLAAPQGKDMVAVLRAHNAKALISEARVSPLRMDVAILWVGRRRIHEWMTPSCRAIGLDFSKGPPPAAS